MADLNTDVRPVASKTPYVHLAKEHDHSWRCDLRCDLHCKRPIWDKHSRDLVREPFPLLMVPSTDPRLSRLTAIPQILNQNLQQSPSEVCPNLEEIIPHDNLPVDLLVVSEVRCVQGVEGKYTTPDTAATVRAFLCSSETRDNWIDTPAHRYKRVLPAPKPIQEVSGVSTATLWLADHNVCGVGSHSSVHKAPFQLPELFITNSRSLDGRVSVIAKLAFGDVYAGNERSDREHLENEAEIFNLLSEKHAHVQQDWHGKDCDGRELGAIIPKFYGYYKPEDDKTLSPILLMEDCGVRVRTDFAGLNDKEKLGIYRQFQRLNETGVIHHSVYPRNILCQPGPLSVESSRRSWEDQVFRIIDFGRSEYMEGESMRLVKTEARRKELGDLLKRMHGARAW